MRYIGAGFRTITSTSLLVLAVAICAPAAAQSVASAEADENAAPIVVTGSRGLQRTVTESPTPIDIVTGADLARTGKTGVLAALNQLIPSFNQPSRAGGGTAAIIGTGGLRGLNPDQTLVLVNGKRRHKTSLINAAASLYNGSTPVDLDLIPVSAIDHIEVLRDGAAAKYGSDAIAGVINIILKSDKAGGFASLSGGQNMDRSDGETYEANASVGFAVAEKGFITLSAQAKKQRASNRAVPISGNVALYNRINGALDPREATIDRLVTKNYGAFPQETLNTSYSANYDFGDVTWYSFGTFSQRRSVLNGTFRPPSNVNSLPEIYPNGLRPGLDIREQDFDFAAGLKGKIGGWDWDASSTYGRNRARLIDFDTINASLGPISPTDFYAGTQLSSEWVNSVDLTKGYSVGNGRLQVSLGAQHRRETYTILAGDPLAYAVGNYVIPAGQPRTGERPAPGAQGGPNISPADAGRIVRHNLAAYLDLAYDPNDRLSLGLAGRFEHFDDASGDTFTVQATGRYAVAPWLAVRGSVGTGFRAPSLAQQIFASTSNQFRITGGVANLIATQTIPVSSPAAIALGAEPLTPEKSTSFSAGVVIEPLTSLNITIDGYRIDVRDRIAITGLLTGPAVSAILVANGLTPNLSAQYYTNALDTRTKGVDVVATYRANLHDLGQLRLSAGFNYNETDVTDIIPNPPELSSLGAGYILFDRIALGNITDLAPKTKNFFGANWSWDRFMLTGRLTRYGSYTIPQAAAAADQRFGAKWIADLEAGYQITDNLNLAIGANNLFNTYPDAAGVLNPSLGHQQYGGNPASPFGFTGGYYYGRITVSF